MSVLLSFLMAFSPTAAGDDFSPPPIALHATINSLKGALQLYHSDNCSAQQIDKYWGGLVSTWRSLNHIDVGDFKRFNDKLTDSYFQAVQQCVQPKFQTLFVQQTGAILMMSYPELSYSDTVARIQALGAKRGIIFDAGKIAGIQRPDQCSTVSLYNSQTAKGPFHMTDQSNYGTCYAHAAVRAMDYWNYSNGSKQPVTSIAAATLAVNVDKYTDHKVDVDGGQPADIMNNLLDHGGCAITDVDVQQNSKVDFLTTFTDEMNQLLLFEAIMDPTVYNTWAASASPITLKIVARAMANEMQWQAIHALKLSHVSTLINAYKNLSSQEKYAYNDLASFVFKKAYCRGNPIQYKRAPVTDWENYDTTKSASDWQGQLDSYFRRGQAGAPVLGFCANVFDDPDYVYDPSNSSDCGGHAVVVVGEGYDNRVKQCTYQLLNSWADHDSYAANYQKELSHGIVWLPLSQIVSSGLDLVGIKAP